MPADLQAITPKSERGWDRIELNPEATAVLQEVFAAPASSPSPPEPGTDDPEQTGPELLPPTTQEEHARLNGEAHVPEDFGANVTLNVAV